MSQASRQRVALKRARRRGTITAFAALAAVVVAVGLLLASRGGSSGAGPALRVSMTDYGFAPSPIEVSASEARFTIANDGKLAHDFVVPQAGKGTADQLPGTSATLDLRGLAPGTYAVVCDLPGHRAAGMETTLVIR
jgi:uncharacterized cupredoxin-like copper-binding protein